MSARRLKDGGWLTGRGRLTRAGLASLLPALLLATPSPGADPQPSAGPAASSALAGGLETLAAAVSQDALARAPTGPLAVYVEGTSPELRRAFATLVLAGLTSGGRAAYPLDSASAAQAEEEARARGAQALVRLSVDLSGEALRARGDVLGTWVNFWSGQTPTRPAVPAAALAHAVPADDAARLLAAGAPSRPAAPAGPLVLSARLLARLPSPPAALAAGDLDGDGREEVVALAGDEVLVLGGTDGQVRARSVLPALPPSPTPCREPYGTLSVTGRPARVAAFPCRAARGELLGLSSEGLRLAGPLAAPRAGSGPLSFTGSLVPGQAALAPELRREDGAALTLPAPLVEVSLGRGRAGPDAGLFLHPDGTATLLSPLQAGAPGLRLRGVGHGSALADVDGDGTLELVSSAPGVTPSPDVLRVHAVAALSGAVGASRAPAALPTAQAELTLPRGRILQLAALDVEGDGRQELVAGVWLPDGSAELHLVRAATGGVP